MKVYDLSCTLKEGMWYYGSPYLPFRMELCATMEKNGYVARKMELTTHIGTHIECQAHWGIGDEFDTIDKYPLDSFVGNAKVFRFNPEGKGLFPIGKAEIIAAGGDKLQEGDIFIADTNWDVQVEKQRYHEESPFFTLDGAEYLVSKKVKCVAADFPMCGDPADGMDFVPEGTPLPDLILYEAKIPTVMGLVGLGNVPDEIFFSGLPLKIDGADGSPVRAVGIVF
jgi:kynurenine formamidase